VDSIRAIANTQKLFISLIAVISVLAWLALWLSGSSPYGVYFHSHGSAHAGHEMHAGHAMATIENPLALAALFALGWLLMTVAMMLPTSIPLLGIFFAITKKKRNQWVLTSLAILGYLTVWLGFGLLAYSGVRLIYKLGDPYLQSNASLLGAGALILAGLFQFSSLKYKCLDKCRSPYSFVTAHWTGRNERLQSFWLGAHHGIFCVGCCWALMLLMFPLGAANIAWMLVLGALMAIEKNVSWGRRFAKPLGVVLLVIGAVLLVNP
jgi:predicted metal-binding membrane protein